MVWLIVLLILSAAAIGILSWRLVQLNHKLLRRTHEVEILKKRGSEFVANVSHELKTPLTSIKGFNETLRSIFRSDPQKAIEFIDRIDQNADRLSVLINEILQLSRIEQMNAYLDWETFSVEPLMRELYEQFQYKLSAKQQILVLNRHEEVSTMRADRRLLEQAVSNLIENSHRYCQDGALIELEVDLILEDQKPYIRWAVKDNGPGINSEDLQRVFERFYRAEKSRNRQSGGTGLGLAIVKHILLSHGGVAYAESEPGKGSTFYLQFPLRLEQ